MNKDIETIISGMECAKNFICCKSGSHNLCHAKDIGMESFLECLERNPKKCLEDGFVIAFIIEKRTLPKYRG